MASREISVSIASANWIKWIMVALTGSAAVSLDVDFGFINFTATEWGNEILGNVIDRWKLENLGLSKKKVLWN